MFLAPVVSSASASVVEWQVQSAIAVVVLVVVVVLCVVAVPFAVAVLVGAVVVASLSASKEQGLAREHGCPKLPPEELASRGASLRRGECNRVADADCNQPYSEQRKLH